MVDERDERVVPGADGVGEPEPAVGDVISGADVPEGTELAADDRGVDTTVGASDNAEPSVPDGGMVASDDDTASGSGVPIVGVERGSDDDAESGQSVAQERRAELRRNRERRGPVYRQTDVPAAGRPVGEHPWGVERAGGSEAGGPIPTIKPLKDEDEKEDEGRIRGWRRGGPNSFGYDPDLWPPAGSL